MKIIIISLVYLTICFSSVFASEYEYTGGASLTVSNFAVQFDDGKTNKQIVISPVTLFGEIQTDRINKFHLSWRLLDYHVDASQSGKLGADIYGNQIELTWLRKARLSRKIKPWFGLGLRASYLKSTFRHTIDADGFLDKRFDKHNQTYLAAIIKSHIAWEIRQFWFLDLAVSYDQPLGNGVGGFGVSSGAKYLY